MSAKVLVIDDSTMIVHVLRVSFEHAGFTVRTALSGEEGLSIAQHFAPDAVVLDRGLPGISGEEVCRRLRALEATRDAGVLMLTATGDARIRQEAIACGVDTFALKPMRAPEIIDLIRRMLDARRARPATAAGDPAASRGIVPTVPTPSDREVRRRATIRALLNVLESVAVSSMLSLKDRGGVESALDLTRALWDCENGEQ